MTDMRVNECRTLHSHQSVISDVIGTQPKYYYIVVLPIR